MEAVKESAVAMSGEEEARNGLLWSTLASELIFFILFQYINFGAFMGK